ncbi:hypothetical protein [Bacillus altitudinis]|nr:hypothetical protein [Bacillus altitudinis]
MKTDVIIGGLWLNGPKKTISILSLSLFLRKNSDKIHLDIHH